MSIIIQLLGGYTVSKNGEVLQSFYSDKVRGLLAYLIVESDVPQSRAKLAGLLWPNTSETAARQSLRQALRQLRMTLGDDQNDPPLILVTNQTLQFNRDADIFVDLHEFIIALDQLGAAPIAVEHYQGDFLDGFYLNDSELFEEWQVITRETLRQDALAAIEMVTLQTEHKDDFVAAQKNALQWRALDPLQEEAHRCLIRTALAQGNHHQAQEYYEQCVATLDAELSITPASETTALLTAIQTEDAVSHSHPLPQPSTPFIGRLQEIARIEQLLAEPHNRMVTIVGTGGTGKTRLALEIARRAEADGRTVGFISLAGIEDDGSDVAARVAIAIGDGLGMGTTGELSPQEALINFLHQLGTSQPSQSQPGVSQPSGYQLIVLDNFEQLLLGPSATAKELVAQLLAECSAIQLLLTSRQRLKLMAEQIYPLEGMTLPITSHEEGATSSNVEESDAVQLFLSQAARHLPDFVTTEEEWPHIQALCQMVEGMPLAIELLCAWLPLMTLAEIREETAKNIDLLQGEDLLDVPERHRSVYAVCDYSIRHLPESVSETFCRLSVFRGGFDRMAAKEVADASPLALARLVEASLLRRDRTGRYTIHMLLRQVGESYLDVTTQEDLQHRHAAWYAGWIQSLTGDLMAGAYNALTAITTERANVDRMWQVALQGQHIELIAQISNAMPLYYESMARNATVVTMMESALAVVPEHDGTALLRAQLYLYLGRAYGTLLSGIKSVEALEKSYRLSMQQGDKLLISLSATNWAMALNYDGRYDAVDELLPSAERAVDQNPSVWGVTLLHFTKGLQYECLGDIAASRLAFAKAEASATQSSVAVYAVMTSLLRLLMEIRTAHLLRLRPAETALLPDVISTAADYHSWLRAEIDELEGFIKENVPVPYLAAQLTLVRATMYLWVEDDFGNAQSTLERAAEMFLQVNAPLLASMVHALLVEYHSRQDHPEKATTHLSAAVQFLPQVAEKMASDYIHAISHYYIATQDWSSAITSLSTLSNSTSTPWLMKQIAEILLIDLRPHVDEATWQACQTTAQAENIRGAIERIIGQFGGPVR
ncbi:MAG: BTAD domain-containing putative transcriptional regulator [Chloroflexota bacterium]